ncbi:hypothetical protein ANCCAN_21451 [Ancylostoma caninum]|uniref:Uncharacterized protein n=1 Tax=Ancylostoma caninum TaxID=29170 RepID=A0A368FKN8_ANCCA|nr:hypothetical protein ANCCAN_21451 [Ancylostoma caninum]
MVEYENSCCRNCSTTFFQLALIRALLFTNGSTPFRVVWHQGKEQDDDVVQLVNHDEEIASEEEEDYTPSLPVFTTAQEVFEPEATSLPAENISGLPAIELNLIE